MNKRFFICYGNYRKQDLKVEKKGENHHVAFFLLILCVFWNFGGLFQSFFLQSYQTKLEAWTRICLSSGTALFPPKSRLLSRNLFALSTCVSKWVIIASCSHFFKTYNKFITCFHESWSTKPIYFHEICRLFCKLFIPFW